jgi:hydroxymethylglutaryl-CoA lyase
MNKAQTLKRLAEVKYLAAQGKLTLPKSVKVFEVGPRDGLQNEKQIIPTDFKIKMINDLVRTGISNIEVGAFVSTKSVSQMSDSEQVIGQIDILPGKRYSALVPNLKGFERASKSRVNEIAVFTAVSESFVQKNINCSIQESLDRFAPVLVKSKEAGLPVRGYISCVMGCPYEGEVDAQKVDELVRRLLDMGCYEVSLGDTIGIGTPEKTERLMDAMTAPWEKLAVHFHDTNGTALDNILVALQRGVRGIDSSVGGLGGCPYAKKSVGNVCTEKVVEMTNYLGLESGIDLDALKRVSQEVRAVVHRETDYLFD